LSYASLSSIIRSCSRFKTCVAKRIPFLKQNVSGVNEFFTVIKIIFSGGRKTVAASHNKSVWKNAKEQYIQHIPAGKKRKTDML